MNKQIYRIVFNQLRGVWMVVAEHVSGRGKLKSSQTAAGIQALPHPPLQAAISRSARWALLAFGGMLPFVAAQADIVADPGASAHHQPLVTNAANGVPLVNIQTPDHNGLSHNTYQQFDVMQNGVILNNSRTNVQTQLGGWVQGNPNLGAGTARTILNEVNSSQPSLLNGFIEVAGSRAQVIVANPSGISCNGCGFINAWRATLTTGAPVFIGGDLTAYRVTGGVIQFLGAGLDTSAVDYTDVISRAVVANAGVWAKTLNVVLGTQQVNVASNGDIGTLTSVAASNEPTPLVALDVAALGGMYAGKIHLIGTELGLGVNNQGVIAATTGELSMDINGQLSNHNTLVAQGNMDLKSHSLQNTGEVLSGAAMQIETGDLNNQNKITAATSMTVNADHISNSNALLAAGQDMHVIANQLSGDGRVLAGGNLTANLQQDYLQTTGLMQADGDLLLTSQGSIVNQTSLLAGNRLLIQAGQLNNSGELSGANTELDIVDTLINSGLIDGINTFINADTLTNQGLGQILGDHVAIQARRLNNLAQTVNGVSRSATIAARERLDLGISETLVNQSKSLIFSLGDMAIGRTLDAQHAATGQGDSLMNNDATIEADGNMLINMASIQNLNAGVTTESVEVGTTHYDQFTPRGEGGLYNSADYPAWRIGNENISWRYGSTYNLPFNFREYWRYIYHGTTAETRIASSQPADIIAGGHLNLIGNVTNNDSRIIAGGDLTHSGGSLNNLNITGDTTTTYSGTAYYYDYDGDGGGFDYDIDRYPYRPAPAVTTTTLPTTQYLANTTATSNGQVASLNSNSLGNQQPDAVRANSLASLYRQTDPSASYLIETSPRFASYGQWLSSDYMLSQLSYDPAYQTKRLGDGFYEQRLVREQINQLTGRRFLAGYSNDQAQYQALMTNGVTFANTHQLVPGVALSAAQVAQLTSDIVWLVTQNVTLPDGSTTQALVPQVYTRLTAGDLSNAGSLISGQTLNINLNTAQSGQNTLINSGTLSGQQVLSIQADNIQNLLGQITGKTVSLNAQQDILNQGGSISAQQALALNAGNDIKIESTTFNSNNSAQTGLQRGALGYSERTGIDRVAGLYVTDSANGVLVAMAGGNIGLDAAHISNRSENGLTALSAGNNIDLTTQQTGLSTSTGVAKNYIKRSTTEEVGTQINTAGDIQLQAGNKLEMRAANVTSDQGNISAQASDIDITAGKATLDTEQYRKTKKSGFMSSSKTERRDTVHDETAIASSLSAESINLRAGNAQTPGNLNITGSDLVASQNVALSATGNVTVTAAQETHQETHDYKQSKTGFSASSTSVGYGSSKLKQNTTITETTQRSSTIGSVEGDVSIEAGKAYTQTASDVVAPQGDIDITAQKVDITSADETYQRTDKMKYKQSGVSVGISNPVVSAIQTTDQMSKAAGQTDDPRMQALAAATTALSVKNAADAVKTGSAGNFADQAGGISLNFSIGSSTAKSSSQTQQSVAKASQVNAGNNVRITATGAGSESDLTVVGSQLNAGQDLSLSAQDQLNLIAAKNTQTLQSSNKSSSASVGVSVGLGSSGAVTPTASFNSSRGKANGADTSWTETQVSAGNKATLQSGTDTTLKGAQVKAKQVVADVGTSGQGNLNVESLQDTATYQSKQSSSGASVSFGSNGIPTGGSVSAGKQKINSDYASVNEQSGIYAGDEGFQVNVNGNTDLKGAIIASTDKAIQDNKNSLTTNTLTTSDIHNKAEYDAKAIAASVGVGSQTGKPTLSGAGYGKDSGDATSKTVTAVSGGDVTIKDNVLQQSQSGKDATATLVLLKRDVHIDDKGNAVDGQGNAVDGQGNAVDGQGNAVDGQGNSTAAKISPIFDADKVAKEIQAQVQITQAFSQQAYQAVGTYVQEKRQNLQNQLKAATTAEDKAAIQAQLKELRIEEQVMNVLIGAVAGTGGAAFAKESLSAAADQMRRLMIDDSKKFVGVIDAQNKALDNIAAESSGVRGDDSKVGGTRVDLDMLCGQMNERCAKQQDANGNDILDQRGIPKLALNEQGFVVFNAKKTDGSIMSLNEFIETSEGQNMVGPTGGIQGVKGTLFGKPYEPGSWQDKLIESFAGSHDYIGGSLSGLYDEQGNIRRGMSASEKSIYDNLVTTSAIPVAAPFAASELLSAEIWQAISILLKGAK
ncbi:hemagglutinin repeat-containing protein [Methylophilus sp. 5]|uniref:hemagglutinin repeat-containing protein n=1 Tax=Methylophilus sp. 5 TaxID=1112274 RepID=UPI0004AE1664|nr:hemagglutinin repeat-containing protein [Methylophilus sp. 5]